MRTVRAVDPLARPAISTASWSETETCPVLALCLPCACPVLALCLPCASKGLEGPRRDAPTITAQDARNAWARFRIIRCPVPAHRGTVS